MDNYIVSARKYRPMTFDSVVGQSALTTTLKNAIAGGKLAHAYLFCGPRGVGKTTCARIFAKTINCLHPNEKGEACNACESCVAFNEQRSYNIHELDAASNNSVDDIRSLTEQVRVPPQVGKYKVFIIDEVHMLSAAAFNAFLKTLEEPPAHVIFVLATTEKHKILPTILSRCQIYDFNRMEVSDIVEHLKKVAANEGYTYEEEALAVIAHKADGGMRDALSIFDQVASFTQGNITYRKVIEDLNVLDYDYYFKLTDQLLNVDISGSLLTLNEILSKGFEANHFMGGLASHFRDLLVSRDESTLPLLEVSDSVRQRYHEQAMRCKVPFLYRALKLCNDCDINYRVSRNKRLLVELTLIEVAQAVDEDGTGCGRGPVKVLKPIFSREPSEKAAPVRTSAGQGAPKATPQVSTESQSASPASMPQSHQPAPAHTPVATASAAYGKPPVRLSIRRKSAPATTPEPENPRVAEPAAVMQQDVYDFEENELNYQWYRFALTLPQEKKAMANRMKNMRPQLLPGYRVEVAVENFQVQEYMNELAPDLLAHLQKELHNCRITLEFRLLERRESEARAYTPRERYAAMLKENEYLRELQRMLNLELV